MHKFRDVGGTTGGLGEFLLGIAMTGLGFYRLANHVMVHSGWNQLWGPGGRGGPVLLVVLIGFGVIFYNGRNPFGWLCVFGGIGYGMVSVLSNLTMTFRPTTLWDTLLMFALFGGGLGLVFKSTRAHPPRPEREPSP